MIDPAVLDAMVMSGCTAEQIAAAVKASMRAEDEARAGRRERDRLRKRKSRAGENKDNSTVVSAVSRGQTRTDVESADTPVPDKEKSPTPPKEINPTPVVSSHASARDFDDFWAIYPNKVGKRDAEAAFGKALKRADFETIMAGLSRYVAKTDDRPWCNPSTWLNQDRWTDSPADVPQRARGSPPPRHETDLQRISRELRERQNDQRRADFEFDGPVIQGFPG